MLFSEVMRGLRAEAGGWTVDVPEDWAQGRSVFGGLQAALAVQAMRALVPAEVPLRTLQVTFIAPVPAGPVRLRAQLLRSGKSATHLQAQIIDGESVLCQVLAVFGSGRPSAVSIAPPQPALEPQKVIEFPFIPGVTPNFTRYFSMRWLRGTPPYTHAKSASAVLELGFRENAAPTTEAHVLAIADVIPPVALSMLRQPVPGSSMTWMVEFLGERFDHLPLQGWRVDAEVVAARDGYTSQSVMVWGPGGVPVALSRQNMVIFG